MAVIILKLPVDIPKTYYQAVGEVVSRMARVEHQLMVAIGLLLQLKNPKQVRVSFMGMNMKARLGAIRALASNWVTDPELKQELCTIVAEARKLADTRNSLAHGVWAKQGGKKTLRLGYALESKDFYMPRSTPYTTAQIVAKAKEVRALAIRLDNAIGALKSQS